MEEGTAGAAALILSTAGIIATMAMHPTGRHVLDGGHDAIVQAALSHWLAVAATPLGLYGFACLARGLRSMPRLSMLAFAVYAIAAVAALNAAVASGFIAPRLVAGLPGATNMERDIILATFHFTGHLNRAFAMVYVVASSAAIILWSIALASIRRLVWLGVGGIVVSVTVIAAVVSSRLRLDVHGFGIAILSQSVWTVCAAVVLYRGDLVQTPH